MTAPSARAFIGPSAGQTPGSGGGLLIVDPNRNIGFGTSSSTPTKTFDDVGGGGGEGHGYVFLVASTTNPGIGLRNTGLSHLYLWSVRNIGSQSRIDLYRESPTLPGKVLLSISETGFVGISAAPTSTYRLYVGQGDVGTTGAFVGAVSGAVSAGNVSSGVFGSLQGNGNFAFPASLAVGTTTTGGLPANGLAVIGSVGIGTSTPTTNLDIFSTTHLYSRLQSSASNAQALFQSWNAVRRYSFGIDTDNFFVVHDNTAGTRRLTIDTGGNVGIGTSTPAARLHVVGGDVSIGSGVNDTQRTLNIYGNGTNPGKIDIYGLNAGQLLRIIGKGSGSGVPAQIRSNYGLELTYGISAEENGFRINQNTTPVFQVLGSNVGIATTTPTEKLEVVGNIKISGSGNGIKFPDGTTQTTAGATANYWSLSGVNLFPTSTTYKVAIGGTVATSSLTVLGDGTFYGASGNLSAGVYYDRTNTAYYLDPGANENAYSLTVAGSVGIGTTAPNHSLTVARSVASGASSTFIHVMGTDSNTDPTRYLIGFSHGNNTADSNIRAAIGLTVSVGGDGNLVFETRSGSSRTEKVRITGSGNVGIATTTPGYKLTVAGTSYFGNQITLAPGVQISATNNTNSISLAGGDITGVDKLTVTTIDPLYRINGVNYATYAASIAGGVKEEYVGKGKLVKFQAPSTKSKTNCKNSNDQSGLEFGVCDLEFGGAAYEHVIDFDEIERGSDLWVWRQTVDFSDGTVQVLATPKSTPLPIAYEIEGNKIIFRASAPVEFSYRLIGNRFDWRDWPTYAKDQTERAGLIIDQ